MEHEHISSLTLAVHCCFGWSTGFWGLESVSSLQSWAQTIHFILLCPQFWDRHNSIHMYHSMKIVFVMTLVLMHIHSSMVACLVYEPSSAVAVSCGRYYLNNRTQSPSQNINHPSQHSIQFQQFLRPLLLPITYNLVTNVHERLFWQLQHEIIESWPIRSFSLRNHLGLALKKENNSFILARVPVNERNQIGALIQFQIHNQRTC